MDSGLFISLEGTDGCGKSTQIPLMQAFFADKGYPVHVLREPGGTVIGEKIRDVILDTAHTAMAPVTEILLYAAARAQIMQEKILPALQANHVVICDRFLDSSLAYQGAGRNLDLDVILQINTSALCGILPHITFFLDIPPETAMERRTAAGKPDRIEKEGLAFQKKVYHGYQALAARYPKRIVTIDATKSIDAIFAQIKERLEPAVKQLKERNGYSE